MNRDQAQKLVERQARAWEQADLEAVLRDFAPDGELISPGGRWRGKAAIRGAMNVFFGQARDVKIEVTRVFCDGQQQGAAEWHWSELRLADGQRHAAEDAIIFEVDADGKITSWREYFDTANF